MKDLSQSESKFCALQFTIYNLYSVQIIHHDSNKVDSVINPN